jgi:preprotein translocase subunit SecG
MIILVTIIHVIVSIFLILVVLLQQGKSADWSGAFGGSSQTTFGARTSATILSKATTVAAIAFMLTSLTLTILISRPGGGSVIRDGATQQQPAQPPADQPAPAPAPAEPTPPPNPPQK